MNKKVVWILSDGLPGHYNQSLGIAEGIAEISAGEPVIVEAKLRSKMWRSMMRLIANVAPALLGKYTLALFYKHAKLPAGKPDILLAAGGNTLFALLSLGKAYQARTVFSGTLKGYRKSQPDIALSVTPLPGARNNLVLDLPPVNIQPMAAPADNCPSYTLLIGGDGAGYTYCDDDWLQLAKQMQQISQRDGITWKLTTSRRTGAHAEQLLKANIDPAIVSEAVWFATKPEKVVRRFMTESKAVFCTEDSLTMVSEAIYSGRPTITLQPQQMTPNDNDAAALARYEQHLFIGRVPVADMTKGSLSAIRRGYQERQPNANIKAALTPLLIGN